MRSGGAQDLQTKRSSLLVSCRGEGESSQDLGS